MHQRIPTPLSGDHDGYEAWLAYSRLSDGTTACGSLSSVNLSGDVPAVIREEFRRVEQHTPLPFETVHFEKSYSEKTPEAYTITESDGVVSVAASSDSGLIYGGFRLLREIQLGSSLTGAEIVSEPYYAVRMLNHWDDPKFDYTLGPYNITRGFAGNSIFDWDNLMADRSRYRDYARLLASIGINATCINNVNADPDLIETAYLPGIAAMAARLRPYGIRLYLSVCFSAPMVTDGTPGEGEYGSEYPFNMRNRKIREGCLDTANPQDERVQQWWTDKVQEIYNLIPDFGGFVIKANSEGMPGPQDYGLTHADGANCVARALKPHGGTLFWRTFVYGGTRGDLPKTDPRSDSVCQPYLEFHKLDGEFDDNVILQTKNGPADFRADEPPSSLLGAVPQTRQAVEFMAAQEYLGHTTHVAYQAHHWSGILNFDTLRQGQGSTVAAVTAGRHGDYQAGAIVAVPNFGDDANWFGHQLAGANAYAFGCLAWDPSASPAAIASDWTRLTFGVNNRVNLAVERILNESYPTFARYAAPLGYGYMHERCHHFEPRHQALPEFAWNREGGGYDRTEPTGSQYLGQFVSEAVSELKDPATCPTCQLLFFHHLRWGYRMPDGRMLSEYIAEDRIEAVEVVRSWIEDWRRLRGELDPQTWAHIYERLNRQYVHAGKWRDEGLHALARVGQYSFE